MLAVTKQPGVKAKCSTGRNVMRGTAHLTKLLGNGVDDFRDAAADAKVTAVEELFRVAAIEFTRFNTEEEVPMPLRKCIMQSVETQLAPLSLRHVRSWWSSWAGFQGGLVGFERPKGTSQSHKHCSWRSQAGNTAAESHEGQDGHKVGFQACLWQQSGKLHGCVQNRQRQAGLRVCKVPVPKGEYHGCNFSLRPRMRAAAPTCILALSISGSAWQVGAVRSFNFLKNRALARVRDFWRRGGLIFNILELLAGPEDRCQTCSFCKLRNQPIIVNSAI